MTVWHSADTKEKFVYDAEKESYQIWLDKPGEIQETPDEPGRYLTLEAFSPGRNVAKGLFIPEKLPDTIEYDPFNRWSLAAWKIANLRNGDEVEYTGVEEDEPVEEVGPIPTWRVTIEVQAYDIVQALAEAYRGDRATVQRI